MSAAAGRDPLYYLRNFETAISWLQARYGDLWSLNEHSFIERFAGLPIASRALLVRLIMRNGTLFRARRINYPELGDIAAACSSLVDIEWLDDSPRMTLTEVCQLLTRGELAAACGTRSAASKSKLIASLQEYGVPAVVDWPLSEERVYRVAIGDLCTKMRLLYFGNFRQEWKEFVLADLGIFQYEKVVLTPDSRAFRSRADIDLFFRLYDCRRRLHQGGPLADTVERIPRGHVDNEWLHDRRAKLLFQTGYVCERKGLLEPALLLYQDSDYPEARLRSVRVLERLSRHDEAFAIAGSALGAPRCESERQRMLRMCRRLARRWQGAPVDRKNTCPAVYRIDLTLASTDDRVETAAALALAHDDGPVHYVENTLINSLFGLLCWDAIFAAVPGAFFHPFHTGPTDLHSASFCRRRKVEFETCLQRLDAGIHADSIRQTFRNKSGIHSPFVSWSWINESLLEIALQCIPAPHLRLLFGRILNDLHENCTGLPDLIQFWPDQQRYRMIEVKGPGDRLQDNQRRWMEFCQQHEIPVCVCRVRWHPDVTLVPDLLDDQGRLRVA